MIKDCSDPGLEKALEQILYDFFKPWSKAPQVNIHETENLKRLTTRINHPVWNGVFLSQLAEENVDEKIMENIEYFKKLQLPWCWFIGPSSRPLDLKKRINEYGLTNEFLMPGMALELDSMNDDFTIPLGFTVKQVNNLGLLREFVNVVTNVMALFREHPYEFYLYEAMAVFDDEKPKIDYVGYLDGVPVATSTLICSETVAGVNIICTLPEARGKGIGTEMTLVTLREARVLGYKVAVLLSTEMGRGIYRRIGFEDYEGMGFYRFPDNE
jgi:GNAT superfamily N-acetyltransferase